MVNDMSMPADVQRKVDAYLGALTKRLRPLRAHDSSEIVEEIRSHILDSVAAGGTINAASLDRTLQALGTPEELAGRYLADDVLARAQTTHSPFLIIAGLFRWATLSIVGFFVLVGALVSYFISTALVWCAVLKPLHPHSAGLWRLPSETDTVLSLRLGFKAPPAGAVDLLGWWIEPLGLILGFGLFFLTTRLCAWSIRHFRNTRPLLNVKSGTTT
jgi:hypothetical protein